MPYPQNRFENSSENYVDHVRSRFLNTSTSVVAVALNSTIQSVDLDLKEADLKTKPKPHDTTYMQLDINKKEDE